MADEGFVRYLEAKASVERRALNTDVLDEVRRRLEETDDTTVLEVGAGVGSMFVHLAERDVLPSGTRYVAVDRDAELLQRARERVVGWAHEDGYCVEEHDHEVRVGGYTVEFVESDLYDLDTSRSHDLVVAHALLDILDLNDAVPHLLALADSFYFPVCFDGVTAFEPPYDASRSFDRRVERAYHATMDADDRAGASTTGRRVFGAVREAGGRVTAGGASDWVVAGDGYTEDEEVLLRYLVETVHDAVGDGVIDGERLDDWADDRHRRIDDGDLSMVVHNLDLAGRSR